MPDYTVVEFTMSDGSMQPAIVAKHENTAAYLISLFTLIEFAERTGFKMTAMDEILRVYKLLVQDPTGEHELDKLVTDVLESQA